MAHSTTNTDVKLQLEFWLSITTHICPHTLLWDVLLVEHDNKVMRELGISFELTHQYVSHKTTTNQYVSHKITICLVSNLRYVITSLSTGVTILSLHIWLLGNGWLFGNPPTRVDLSATVGITLLAQNANGQHHNWVCPENTVKPLI